MVLVFTRRQDQTITIGNPDSARPPIEVTIIEVRGDQMRLGRRHPGTSPFIGRKYIFR